jgi:hypothetical protein
MAFGSQLLDRHEARGTGTDHGNFHSTPDLHPL